MFTTQPPALSFTIEFALMTIESLVAPERSKVRLAALPAVASPRTKAFPAAVAVRLSVLMAPFASESVPPVLVGPPLTVTVGAVAVVIVVVAAVAFNTAPALTVTGEDCVLETISAPLETVVAPEYVFAPDSSSEFEPCLLSVKPEPEITPLTSPDAITWLKLCVPLARVILPKQVPRSVNVPVVNVNASMTFTALPILWPCMFKRAVAPLSVIVVVEAPPPSVMSALVFTMPLPESAKVPDAVPPPPLWLANWKGVPSTFSVPPLTLIAAVALPEVPVPFLIAPLQEPRFRIPADRLIVPEQGTLTAADAAELIPSVVGPVTLNVAPLPLIARVPPEFAVASSAVTTPMLIDEAVNVPVSKFTVPDTPPAPVAWAFMPMTKAAALTVELCPRRSSVPTEPAPVPELTQLATVMLDPPVPARLVIVTVPELPRV